MRKFLFNSRNFVTKPNYNTRTTWNYHNNNTNSTNPVSKATTFLTTKSPTLTKRSVNIFTEDTKSNTTSSTYTTPSVTKKTHSYFQSPTNCNRELDGIRLNVALLRNQIERLDTIVNDTVLPHSTSNHHKKPQVKKVSVLKLNPKLTIPPNKTLSNLSTPRNKPIPLRLSVKKDKNNKHNKISTFSIDYPVSLTEGNVNESKHKRRVSEYFSKPKVLFIPSKEATINYIMSDKTKKTKSFI